MIKKAIIPAAGFGTRLLPATKSQPKEMLPIVDKPVIQYVVEEAVASGITDILMVIGRGKRSIEEHFDRSYELEDQLEGQGKLKLLKEIKAITELADIHFIWQKELLGLGDAVMHAKKHVGNKPFAVMLGDTIIQTDDGKPLTKKLSNIYDQFQEPVFALQEIEHSLVSRYGVFSGVEIEDDVYVARGFVEKPKPDKAPSNLVMAGRYIFTPDIFDYLKDTQPGLHGEVQLTDAMIAMLKHHKMYGFKFNGKRYDIGNKLDFIKTNVELALKRPDMKEELKQWLNEIHKS